eukprot:c26156_g3_i1 orf=722-1936(-)
MAIPPEDFRCPISLELMSDPVILATGQTYDRLSIQRWLDAGHRTCPKTKQFLTDIKLIPNYALRSLIYQWAQTNGVDLKKPAESFSSPVSSVCGIGERDGLMRLKTLVEDLVKSLCSTDLRTRCDAIKEIRDLAKESKEIRICIVEAGAIARILPLLSCRVSQTEEIAVDALLDLSMDDENKVGLVAEGAVDAIVYALKAGSMDTRVKAAATLASLAMVDVNKATIGRRSDAIPALAKLLAEGNTRGRKEALSVFRSLCMYPDNKVRVVTAGVIPLLIALLTNGSTDITESSLTLLDFLSASEEGRHALCREPAMPALVKLLKNGTARSKEHAVAVLSSLCMNSRKNTFLAFNAGALEYCMDLMQRGSLRARRKAFALVKAFREFGNDKNCGSLNSLAKIRRNM